MKAPVHYVHDSDGNVQAVQIPVKQWDALLGKLRHYEQVLKLKDGLATALGQVERMRAGKLKKKTLKEALRGA